VIIKYYLEYITFTRLYHLKLNLMLSQSESQIKVERLMNIKLDMNMASLLILEY